LFLAKNTEKQLNSHFTHPPDSIAAMKNIKNNPGKFIRDFNSP